MVHEVAELNSSIELARVYFRVRAQSQIFGHLVPGDFARRRISESDAWREPGISLWRLDCVSPQEALDRVPSRKLKGLAVMNAGILQQLGYSCVTNQENPAHVSLRCRPCDFALNAAGICLPKIGDCGFNEADSFDELVMLSNSFRVVLSMQL